MRAWILWILMWSTTGSIATFTEQPRLETVDGHLFIYGGSDKNLTFVTTSKGYVNVNGENLFGIVQDAKIASQLIKGMKYTALSEIQEGMKAVTANLELYAQRLNACEVFLSGKTKDTSYLPLVSLLNTRVKKLERKVRRISRNLMKNECRKDPCLNGGTCLDRYLGYECRCPEGWEGKKCEKDVNECAIFAGTDLGCQNGATCYNTRGSYECHCAPGWHGLHCLRRTNDCSSGSAAELCGHGICVTQVNSPRGYTCICSQGWKTDENHACTVDVDECATAPCSRNPPVQCHNAPGSFFCGPCPPGYTGNGFQCSDVDECLVENGGCSTEPMVACINTMGSSACESCPPGYSGDGRTCVFVGKCNVDNGGCHPNARCIEVGLQVQCQCPPGYSGFGVGIFGCKVISGPVSANPCEPNPCMNNGRCYSTSANNFTCSCMPGFSGRTCSVIHSCDNNPCQNGGTCEMKNNVLKCKCPPRYRGTFCEEREEGCGEYLKGDEGMLKFPEGGAGMQYEFNCAWVIRVNITKVINITFSEFQLKSSFECTLEWLEIHDGRSTGDATIGKFCSKSLPNNGTIITTQNNVYIWFKTIGYFNSKFHLSWKAVDPVCGGAINASVHGVITSPGYPVKYPNNRDCYWEVSAPIGKRIMFTVFELRLNSGSSCMNDFVEIHEGMSLESALLAKFCNTSAPEIIETPGNTAYIYFHTDNKGTEKGFQMAYHPKPGHPGCGGVYTTFRGEITPPTRNDMYLPNMDCAWVIRLPEDRRIKLEFITFSVQSSRSCRDDFLEVRDGGDITSPLLGKYCGTDLPPPISSNHKTIFVRFFTDEIVERSGFKIRYKSLCDETFTAPSGVIKSPGYPNTYKSEEECVMIIEQPAGKIINLEFQEFEIESTYRCIFDYVEIRDGHDESSPLIGRYCGSNRPGRVVSTHNYLYIKMVTDNNVELGGFYGNYSTVDVSCGGIFTAPTGVINSPTEGDHYPSKAYCRWVIAVKPGQLIQLSFPKFKVEGFNGCYFDYVAVYDNSTELKGNNLIGRYCNNNLPPLLTSASNVLTIIFSSDPSFTDEGFSATYIAVNGSSTCGGKFFTEWGVIKSPNYPDLYPNGITCNWVIHVKNGHKIHLNITDFFLERPFLLGGKKCKFDYLEIRDGGYSSSPLIGRYCGTKIPNEIVSQSNNLYIEFSSDNLDSGRGFQIFWDGSVRGCGGTLTGPKGSIISPNYPERYGSIVNCLYHISVSHGSRIRLNFVDLELETSASCYKEYLEVLDGSDLQGKSLGRFCTLFNVPPGITSSGNHLTIKFKSGLSSTGKGFYINYFTLCRTNITGYRGVIESPNYPNDYPTSLDCMWSIKAPLGNKIAIQFTDFVMRGSCRNAYLEVSDSDPETPPLTDVKKYCRNNKTLTMESSDQFMNLRFVTSERLIGGHFRLEWAVKGCGGYLTKPSGTFTSPNYPNLYPTNINCEWWITVDPMKSISLVFSDISFERNEDCSFDGVEVYGGSDKTAPLLTRICTTRKDDVVITSSGNQLYIFFHSDPSNVARGFKASYYTTASSCGGLFTASSGTIHSRNYPMNYQADNCEWRIYVDVNHRVNLTFIKFDVNDEGNCTYASVEVFDGSSTAYPSVWRHCGNKIPEPNSVISTGDSLTVRMKVANASFTAMGFFASYSMICGGIVDADVSGVIEGGSELNLAPGAKCTWLITTSEPDGHVMLTLSNVELSQYDEYDSTCYSEHLLVYDGPDENSTLIGTYCKTTSPLPIVSHGNQLLLKFVASYNVNSFFQVMYSSASSACGGDLYSQRGQFASPNYPDSYPPNSECIWTLNSAPGNKIQLNFKVFDVGASENCNDEYVEIRDKDATGKLVGVYCGSDNPGSLTAHNTIWVKFKSKAGGSGSMKFLADYSIVYGNEINGTSGQIASPNYPRMFSSYTPVSWRITVGFKNYILFEFKDLYLASIAVEDCTRSLTIYDGFDDTAPLLIKKCDAEIPGSPLTSSSNVAYIVLQSEPFHLGGRFLLDWSETKSMIQVPIAPTSSPIPGCGGEYFLSSKDNSSVEITVPGSSNPNQNKIKCSWKISCPEEEHLSVSVKSFDAKHFVYCDFTNLEVSTNFEGSWKEVVKFCGNKAVNGTYHGHSVILITASFEWAPTTSPASLIVSTECGGSIRKTNGIIDFSWKNYSKSHHVSQAQFRLGQYSCQWDIVVTPGRTIRTNLLHFSDMVTQDGICQDNYFSLRNGGSEDSPYLGGGVYCSVTGIVPRTTSNKLFIKVLPAYTFYAFTLMFEEVPHECGGKVTLDSKMNSTTISSPNYPSVPPIKVECIWTFVTVGVRRLRMDFLDRFDLAYSNDCKMEYVSVHDGGTELSDEMGRYCQEKPSTLRTTGNMLYVKYYTNTTDPQNGFRARISIDDCGGIITGSSGVLTSPGYPYSYPYNVDCHWEIETTSMSTLKIKVVDVDLPHNLSVISAEEYSLATLELLLSYMRGDALHVNGTNCTSAARLTISEPFSGEVRPRGSRLTSKESNVPGDQNQSLLPLAVVCSNGETPSVQTSRNKAVITFKSAAWDVGHYFVSPRGFKLNFTSARSSCVQRMYSESGVIESPKKLVNRIGFYNCEWVITVPRGRRVSVTFADSIIPFFSTGVVLVAYNDHSYRSQIGSLIPSAGGNKVVKSTSNLMLISYVSPYVPRYSSFRLLYNSDEPAVCGGNISDSSGSIESPKNLSSFYCPWFFFQQPGGNKTLSITVYDAVIGNKTGLCTPRFGSFLYLKAKGESLDHQAVLCGNVTSETIRTPFTRATLTGLKNLKYSGEVNFKVKYKVLPCGGVLTGSKFVVTNPNYPDDYPSGMECSWLVTVPFDGIVKITFEELKLGNKPDCKDYLTVKNGPRLDSPTIGTLCGSPTDSKPIISETPSVLIEFHSDESSSENSSVRRFKLKIEEMDSACGGIVHSEDTEITSPHFPKPYANNEECEWEIRTREGMHVGLVFQDRFHIEDSTDCKKDYLKVYDYVEEEWKLLKTLCGREFPPPINSTTNRMKIVFHSDSTVSSDGFKAKWTSNCGATFSNVKSGRIVSPGYPGRYPGDIRCEYIITYPAMEIDFNFTSFDLEKGLQGLCSYDSVEFFRYTWQNEYRSEGKFCGSVLPKPISIYRHAKIVFTTDTYVNKTGFELLFSVDVCGGVISKPTELNFTFGRGFSLRNDCVWNITAPENKIVVLRFTRIMLPISTNCEDTSLQVIEYNSTGSPVVLAKMCGLVYNNLPVIHSTKSNVTLLTDKLYHEPQKGFRVLISFSYGKEQGCGGSVSLNSNPATITSPDVNRDGKYEDLMDCSWLILAKPFHYITANFLELDIDNCGTTVSSNLNCSCDFVELRNGIDPNSDVIQTGCGDAPPPPVVSSGSAMSLRFVTDATNSRRGFTVRFSTLLSECGFGFLNVTDKPQTLTSPKYPDKYPLGVRCRWTITDRTNTLHIEKKVIHIHVIEWDMEDGDMLTFRKTGGTLGRIIDGDESRKQNQPSYVIGKSVYYSYTNAFLENDRTITGKGNSLDYYALSDEVTIDFVSKGKSPKKGFKLEYSIAGCARNYSSDHGQIVVNFRRNLMCDIVIEAPTSNHTISLYITNIQMYYGDYTCPTSSVQVFDGRSDGAALLKKFCGTEIPNPIYSSGQYLTIKLNIDSKKELYPMTKQDVLDMTFTTTTKGPGCGGRVSAMRGVIYSAGYPNNVRKNTKCRWDITVPSGLEAVIKFVAFDIGPANTCETDYVTISDVDLDGSENLRSTFCGGQEPAEIRSQADGVAVVYHTSVHNGGTGWKIEYSLVVPGSEIR